MQVEVVLPLAIDQAYTYNVPVELEPQMAFGIRVEVQFGKRRQYSGIVVKIIDEPHDIKKKELLGIIDQLPIVQPLQFQFWMWMSRYYLAYLGEVMNAALPSRLKLSSETKILKTLALDEYETLELDDDTYLLAEALQIREEISLTDVYEILDKKSVYKYIQRLLDLGLAEMLEELKNAYVPKSLIYFELTDEASNCQFVAEALGKVSSSEIQTNHLLLLIQLKKQKKTYVTKNDLRKTIEVKDHALNALIKKGIIRKGKKYINRYEVPDERSIRRLPELSLYQRNAYDKLKHELDQKNTCLIHGITGSGKTQLYLEYIKEMVESADGGQILFLLPEIALTSQIIDRIRDFIDYPFLVYHSRIAENDRVDIYEKVSQEDCFVIGARSALLLPFKNLKLVIVDEEHDPSYKQSDPSPRYHGRDAAIMLASLHSAKTILGSATPSIESFTNAKDGKYGFVGMFERFGDAELPEISIANLAKAKKQQPEQLIHFTPELIDQIKQTLAERQQVILFQNRRGYSPYVSCVNCGWTANCVRCDISLTHHKRFNELRCHYCGYRTKPPASCPECGFWHIENKGAGTERIESELKELFPDNTIKRFDADTVGSKRKLEETIFKFDQGEIDVLVGTQMLTKGLDFKHVGLVGILNMESLLAFPHFRATERAYQTIVQVAGRAGRHSNKGKVIIQLHNPKHKLLRYIQEDDYNGFYFDELRERNEFHYPPQVRIIELELKHKNQEKVSHASQELYKYLRGRIGGQLFEPVTPYISYINLQHLRLIVVKTPNNSSLRSQTKQIIKKAIINLKQQSGLSNVRVNIDVDPA